MAINRDLWDDYFFQDDFPAWKCPHCNVGIIEMDKKSLKIVETVESIKDRSDDDWEPGFIRETFNSTFECSNSKCKGTTFCIGNSMHTGTYDSPTYYEQRFYPMFFVPTLNIFELPEDCPWDVEDSIKEMFALYWSDKAACANRMRIVVENILDDKAVRKTKERKGKRSRLSLHGRIILFKNKKPHVADTLEAIKWIGNSGSHISEMDTESLLDGLELLESAIEELYGGHRDRLISLSKKINKRKGPI